VYRVRDRDDQELQARRLGRSEIARATSRVRSNVVWPCDPVRRVRDFSGAHFRPISDTIFFGAAAPPADRWRAGAGVGLERPAGDGGQVEDSRPPGPRSLFRVMLVTKSAMSSLSSSIDGISISSAT